MAFAICKSIVDQLSDEEVAEYKEQFRVFDKDGDGKVTPKELGDVFEALGVHATIDELQEMINEADADGDGAMDFNDFLMLMAHRKLHCNNDEELRASFCAFDQDRDGFISKEEMGRCLSTFGEDFTDEEVADIVREGDTDGDGKINYEEFVAMMKNQAEDH